MKSERWLQIEQIFYAALVLKPEERPQYLDKVCADDPPLRKEVEFLLTADKEVAAKRLIDMRMGTDDSIPTIDGQKNSSISERFLIQRRLGSGGFGVVYKAYDRERDSMVALKSLNQTDANALYRFKQEFRTLADLTHPNLVKLYELISDGNKWFFTMEMVEGVDFLEYVKEETGVNMGRLREVLRQLVEGICSLHDAGRIHRDLKPSNVLVNKNGQVKILDFGLAAELAPEGYHQSIEITGTPEYMSPEQCAGNPVSKAGDWYSVGVMLYETLTGGWPFEGWYGKVFKDKLQHEATPPSELVDDIPEDLDALCRQLLRRLPEERPTGEELLERLGKVQTETSNQAVFSQIRDVPFVGREQLMKALEEAFQAAKQGSPVMVNVCGHSGMGKSTLTRHFIEHIQKSDKDVVVLAGRCYKQESVPYKALDSVVDALSRYLRSISSLEAEALLPRDVMPLALLFPVLYQVKAVAEAGARRNAISAPDSQELRRKAFAALRELLARLANKRPLIIFIDDLQWGDSDSAALLGEILSPPDPPDMLLIISYRSEDINSSVLQTFLSSISAAGSAIEERKLVVEELSESESRELALALMQEEDQVSLEHADAIARESKGSPFFVDILARYSKAGDGSTQHAGMETGQTVSEKSAAIGLDEVLQTRISQLPEAALRLLEIVAIAGQQIERDVAKQAAGLKYEEQSALSILQTGRMIRCSMAGDQEKLETYHDKIRETVVANLSPETLKTLHQTIAMAMEASDQVDSERLSIHFQEAGDNEKAAKYAAAAADQAAKALAFVRAARLCSLALELKSWEDTEARTLQLKLGDALANAGHGVEAAKAYLAAAEGSSLQEVFELRRKAAELFLNAGYVHEGMELLDIILKEVGMELDKPEMSALLSMAVGRGKLWLRGTDYKERNESEISPELLKQIDVCWTVLSTIGAVNALQSIDFQTKHLSLALNAGEPYRLARALAFEGVVSSFGGRRNKYRTAKLNKMAKTIAERINNPELLAMVNLTKGQSAFLEGRWRRAWELFCIGEKITKEQCEGVHQGFASRGIDNALTFALRALIYLGDINELLLRLPELLKNVKDKGSLYVTSNLKTTALYIKHMAADEPDKARQEIEQASIPSTSKGLHIQHFLRILAQGETSLYSQAASVAFDQIKEQLPLLKKSLLLNCQIVLIEILHLQARAALAIANEVSDSASYLAVAEKNAKLIMREKTYYGDAWADLLLAGVAATRGRAESAIAYLKSAEKKFENVDMALYAAAARRRRGELLAGDEGSALITTSDNWMNNQKIKNPARMTDMLAPGRW